MIFCIEYTIALLKTCVYLIKDTDETDFKKNLGQMPADEHWDEDAEILFKKYLISGIVSVIRDKKIVLKIIINSQYKKLNSHFGYIISLFFLRNASCKMITKVKQI